MNSPRIHDITELKRVPRTAFAAVSKSICDQKTLLPSHTVSKQHFKDENIFSCLFILHSVRIGIIEQTMFWNFLTKYMILTKCVLSDSFEE